MALAAARVWAAGTGLEECFREHPGCAIQSSRTGDYDFGAGDPAVVQSQSPGTPATRPARFQSAVSHGLLQVALGITTLLMLVPIPLASAHQAGALVLFTLALFTLHTLRRS